MSGQAHFESVLKLGPMPTELQRIDLGPGEDIPLTEEEDAKVQYRSAQAKEAYVLKEVKGTREIHFGGSSNHNMASDFRVSGRSNKNTDGRCDTEKTGGSGVLRHLYSSIDAMDLVEGGVGQGACFCRGSPASKLDCRQDMVPTSPVFGLAQHAGNGVSGRNGTIVTVMRPNKAEFISLVKNTGTRI